MIVIFLLISAFYHILLPKPKQFAVIFEHLIKVKFFWFD